MSTRSTSTIVTLILGAQALGLAAAGVVAFAGIGVGSTALRIGVGLLFLVLGGIAGGIALGVSEGSPAARAGAVVFEGFAVALVLLWFAPTVAMASTTLAIVVLAVVHRHRRSAVASSAS
ncbi:MAG: hypothetical protein MUP97_07060 [Acidimicrobiia bacterium]|jgi:hypothetical protein|nr:hypothetical protein [Acidimicrobiia bacterium]